LYIKVVYGLRELLRLIRAGILHRSSYNALYLSPTSILRR
jgi:hypothetical protein